MPHRGSDLLETFAATSIEAVSYLEESSGVLDSMVLSKTPSWDTMPLHVVEYPASAYWMVCCRIGLFSRGARGEGAR